MKNGLYLAGGFLSLLLGAIGMLLPLLPTTPFVILAAFCFARSSPRIESWLINHRQFGPHIRNWRHHGAINKKGKKAAMIAFAISALLALFFLAMPWKLIPLLAALIGGGWIWTRPEGSVEAIPPPEDQVE